MALGDNVHSEIGDLYDNGATRAAHSVASTTAPTIAPQEAMVNDAHSNKNGEDNKRAQLAEIDALRRNVERLNPELAKSLPMVSENMNPTEIAAIKEQVAKMENELQANENLKVAQGMIGGLLAIGAGGLLSNDAATNDPGVTATLNHTTTKDPILANSLQNPQFEQLLASASKNSIAHANPQNAEHDILGTLSTPSVPNIMVAAIEESQSRDPGRVRRA